MICRSWYHPHTPTSTLFAQHTTGFVYRMIQEHTKEQVESIIQPYTQDLREAVFAAWQMWRESHTASHLLWKGALGANLCNNFLNTAMQHFYSKSASVRVETKPPYAGLYIESALYLRFKKGKRNLKTSNYPTKGAKSFHDKSMPIPSLEGLSRLELVYVPSKDLLDIERIMLVSKDKGRIDWTIDLLAQAQPEQTNLEMFVQPEPQGTAAQRVIKKKGGTSDERKQLSAGKGGA